ncbi:uncharacterized protein [Antedon mediterranea]|uniref:uncharacterized protein isoform X2 n=1 Tax=Antedon mediterranea TaxID=105859 RepID=UPI003AF9985C
MIFLMVLALLASVHADPILRFKPNNLNNQITCPDKSVCDDDNTCCELESGEYGCCPYVKATCCSDKAHCCPEGTTCDMAESKCLKGDISFPWMEKTKASPPGTIMCPDRQSYCPSSQYTCCKASIGKYECCPQPKATCCSDGQHCCPTGYTCDEATSMCTKGNIEMFWYEKLPAQKLPSLFEVQDVNCPDGKSTCPSGSSCCALKDGYYGCCPFDGAVCCDDKKHCCPSGYTCSSSSCIKGIVTLSFTEVITKKIGNVKCQDGQSYCPPMSTCCKQDNGYGCCPLENAECCSDGLHCCPEGYKCDIAGGTCENYSSTVELIKHSPAQLTFEANPVTLEAVMCPDGQSQCPDGNTCCKLSSGQYGCCPLPSAVCCSDGLHCCPTGYTCDVSAGTCAKSALTVPWTIKTEAKQVVTTKNPVCPDGHSQCPDSYTCCKMSTGLWGCCPLPNAVCCEDGIHCCPKDNICDDATPGCIHGDIHTPWYEKVPALSVESVVCPDGQSQCPDGNTCCKLSSGQYGCCPLPKAVCCSDGLHCCPSGYTCDVSAGTCAKGALTVPWLEKTEAKSVMLENVQCDSTHYCPDGSTCCKLSSGQYGCCPIPNAVCCSDGQHCCPSGYTCDVSGGTCTRGALTVPWLEKTEARSTTLESVVCPDGQSQCPDGNTCCKLSSGQYGCCPLQSAVCCSDGLHCCPSGYTCDVSAGTCAKGALTVPWVEKTEAKSIKLEAVMCPDGQSQCPDGNTCCKLSSGQYGCCPLQSAVCCSDGLHCCPSGYTCDVSAGTCAKGALTVPWVEKTEAKSIKLEAVMCPDGQSQCPDGNTCCKLSSGQYGCCPLQSAVCCSDGLHCCPSGYTCDVSAGTCAKGALTVPWVEKTEAKSIKLEAVMCPDGQSQCPDGNTCCKLSSGQYGCCPLQSAVCCSDGLHCCPSGYTCDVSAGTCAKGALTVPWLEKTEAISIKLEAVMCPDGQSQCPDGNTCCKLSSGQYGCCPLPKAVCCSDGLHCCPSGYTCDVSGGTCTKGTLTVPWVEKTEAKSLNLKSVTCPDGQSQCPDNHTCCELTTGQYGCCPLPNAQCCSDGQHCCPKGYSCDSITATCLKGLHTVPWVSKQPASLRNVICPGGRAECDTGNTCCKLSSGEYGCCPLPKAVCCSDKLHCCPEGQTCDTSEGKCLNGDQSTPWLTKTAARPVTDIQAIVCPDGRSQCPNGNTCCASRIGTWLCCPLRNAVCCSDGVNCCPSGYTCNVVQGTCVRQSDIAELISLISN